MTLTTATPERPKSRIRQPNAVVLSYSELLKTVKAAGLLERRVGFYITVFSVLVLLIYMGTFREMLRVAADPSVPLDAVRNPSPLLHAVLALGLLLTATVLGIYKPGGLAAHSRRTWAYAAAIALALLVVVFHFAGGGIHPH